MKPVKLNRRVFIKNTGIATMALSLKASPIISSTTELLHSEPSLQPLSENLLSEWCDALLQYQVTDPSLQGLYGGILCPACNRIHGRCGDAIYPLIFLSKKTGNKKYLNAAILLFEWMEKNVSKPDGSWVNDVNISPWNGITVFGAISLAEALYKHADILPENIKNKWLARLKQAAEFIHNTFHIEYSNINYPITASYALLLLGKLFNEKKYIEHAQTLAHQSIRFFTKKDQLLFGEGGGDRYTLSPKGCLPVDLGYNVEESLPALAMYGLMEKDEKLLQLVVESLTSHMEFMLPDGAWDNSWGTRSFKWTYWGSRTSDGCQPAYALLADRNPVFGKVALQNTILLKQCTHNGLLYGGPHYHTHGVSPCVHHTFCHAKALAAILDHGLPSMPDIEEQMLPRDVNYEIKYFEDIQTYLVSNENWNATITVYDREYKHKNGHPTGGALSLLYHRKLGTILASSMNQYQLIEATNMQAMYDPYSMPLTMRIQTKDGRYMNISDLNATVEVKKTTKKVTLVCKSRLVDKDQKEPLSGRIDCQFSYSFAPNAVEILCSHNSSADLVELILPCISSSDEEFILSDSKQELQIHKKNGTVKIKSNASMELMPVSEGKKRIFNFVPGMEALPFKIVNNNVHLRIEHNY